MLACRRDRGAEQLGDSVLVPWNTCCACISGVLGVSAGRRPTLLAARPSAIGASRCCTPGAPSGPRSARLALFQIGNAILRPQNDGMGQRQTYIYEVASRALRGSRYGIALDHIRLEEPVEPEADA
jgi:hypothetical protein